MTYYIFVTGGVVSSLGKGLTTASLGAVLEARGLAVTTTKLDPYINIDSGTMNPFQHGEVFVTEDGAETDLDLGHYERFLNSTMRKQNCYTAGQIYDRVIRAERSGEYLGATVQVIPHITDEIKRSIRASENAKGNGDAQISLVEIGGTIGDIESQPFVEAIRQIRLEVGSTHSLFVHLTLVPQINTSGELKTKPTQHSVKEMRSIGLQPDMLLCRNQGSLGDAVRKKIALFTNVEERAVISLPDLSSIYHLPERLHEEKVDTLVMEKFNLAQKKVVNLRRWKKVSQQVSDLSSSKNQVDIAIVGKYVDLPDAYMSLNEALMHAGLHKKVQANLHYVEADSLATSNIDSLKRYDAILIPGGFGERGVEGMIMAAAYARKCSVPYLGICMGMQVAIIEYARNQAKLDNAHSTEFAKDTPHPVVGLVEEWWEGDAHDDYGGTMRLGSQACRIQPETTSYNLYGKAHIRERHRHRYECNNHYVDALTSAGLVFSAWSEKEPSLVEMIEVQAHPWYLACQFHPEFQSKPWEPHPLFLGYVTAAQEYHQRVRQSSS